MYIVNNKLRYLIQVYLEIYHGNFIDNVPSVFGNIKGFVSLIRKNNGNVITTYCLLQQEALIAKAINHELKNGLNKVWKCNYRSLKSHLSSRFVKKLKQVSFSAQRSGSYEEEKCHKCMKWRMICLLSLILSNKNNFESCWKILGFQRYLISSYLSTFTNFSIQGKTENVFIFFIYIWSWKWRNVIGHLCEIYMKCIFGRTFLLTNLGRKVKRQWQTETTAGKLTSLILWKPTIQIESF